MFRYTTKRFLMILFVCLAALGFTPSTAQAEAPSTTVTSSYDESSPDNLSFSYAVGVATCDDVTTSDAWTSGIDIASKATSALLYVSVEEGKGGTVSPQDFGTLYAHGNGSTTASITLSYQFDNNPGESTNFTVQAPEGGCAAPVEDTPDDIDCTLLNFTPQSAYNEETNTYAVGTAIKFETLVSGSDAGKVAKIVFEGNFNNGAYSVLQSSDNNKYDLLLDKAGHWTVNVVLMDIEGHGLHINNGSHCTAYLDSASASEATPPGTDEPTGTTDGSPETSTPLPNDNTGSGEVTTVTTGSAASADTLPVTGARTTFAFVMGLVLLMTGVGFVMLGKPKLSHK